LRRCARWDSSRWDSSHGDRDRTQSPNISVLRSIEPTAMTSAPTQLTLDTPRGSVGAAEAALSVKHRALPDCDINDSRASAAPGSVAARMLNCSFHRFVSGHTISWPVRELSCHMWRKHFRKRRAKFKKAIASTDVLTVQIDLTQEPQSKSEMPYLGPSLDCIACDCRRTSNLKFTADYTRQTLLYN
jgi:hypothetical protein